MVLELRLNLKAVTHNYMCVFNTRGCDEDYLNHGPGCLVVSVLLAGAGSWPSRTVAFVEAHPEPDGREAPQLAGKINHRDIPSLVPRRFEQ